MSNINELVLEAAAHSLIPESQNHLTKAAYDRLRGNMTAYRAMARAVLEAAEAESNRQATEGKQ